VSTAVDDETVMKLEIHVNHYCIMNCLAAPLCRHQAVRIVAVEYIELIIFVRCRVFPHRRTEDE